MFNGLKHMVVPVFGALANFACMAFYVIGPLEGLGSWKEPIIAVVLSGHLGSLRSVSISRATRRSSEGIRCRRKLRRLDQTEPPLCGLASPSKVLRGPVGPPARFFLLEVLA